MTRIPLRSGYCGKVISLGPIAHWPLYDLFGTVARNSMNTFNTILDGAYTGVTLGQPGIGDGFTCPLFDGATNLCNATTTAIVNLLGAMSAGSVTAWAQASSAAIWTDGAEHDLLRIQTDANNLLYLRKSTTNNTLQWRFVAGAIGGTIDLLITPSSFFNMTLTWGGGNADAYYNGAHTGAQWAIGSWAGAVLFLALGAGSLTPTAVWSGSLAHIAIWNRVLSAPEILSLATVP